MSFPKRLSLASLGVASLCLSPQAVAFELGTCALIQVHSETPAKTSKLAIAVEARVLNAKADRNDSGSAQATTDLADFSFKSSGSDTFGSEFSTSSFNLPSGTTRNEDTGLLDFGADSKGL